MGLLKFLGLDRRMAGRDDEPDSLVALGERLDALPPADARLASACAYLLARVAGADLRTEAVERETIRDRLVDFAGLEPEHAALVAEAAIEAAGRFGSTDDHLVARAFRDMADQAERLRLMRCLYAVAAADETISAIEDNEIFEIAAEIGLGRSDVVALRAEWKDRLGSMKALPRER